MLRSFQSLDIMGYLWVLLVVCLFISKAMLQSNTAMLNYLSMDSSCDTFCVRYKAGTSSKAFSISCWTRGDECAAKAVYRDNRKSNGWGELSLESSKDFSDPIQAFAIGFAEGAVTYKAIKEFWDIVKMRHPDERLKGFWEQQIVFIEKQVSIHEDDQFWVNIGLAMTQLKGILEGYNSKAERGDEMSLSDLYFVNSDVDNFDVSDSFKPSNDINAMSKDQLIEVMQRHSRCSALLKWTGSDFFVGHSTWEDFNEMNRMFKTVKTHFKRFPNLSVSFSGYPAMISSSDDYFITSHGLVITETTISMLDPAVYETHVKADGSIVTWLRSLVASRISKSAQEWTKTFSRLNSGTNNDQWMVLDTKKVHTSTGKLSKGAVWMIEAVPGLVRSKDITGIIRKESYFASYNVPFLPDIRKRTKYDQALEVHGERFDYKKSNRAQIFHREQATIHSLQDMRRVMRHNKWQSDPLSKGCPQLAIAARFDISSSKCKFPELKRNNGAIDAKVTSIGMAKRQISWAISGPSSDDQIPFTFTDETFPGRSSLPDKWDFEWVLMKPLLL